MENRTQRETRGLDGADADGPTTPPGLAEARAERDARPGMTGFGVLAGRDPLPRRIRAVHDPSRWDEGLPDDSHRGRPAARLTCRTLPQLCVTSLMNTMPSVSARWAGSSGA
ncbi:hypothetical protein GCM10010347_20980 [Streptomyces cirratus]|uniref:Uncharacterized protein n=1 Tax=Streptomyces cirratus TaxID=68187 RepID=A0ABQ3EUJ9_9ACTN|nr:hypothetical protein GCM10010347_20980 [Streptomyces cirratus]